MGLEPAAVYRTTNPKILAAWDTEITRRAGLYAQALEFTATVDPDRDRDFIGLNGETLVGLSHRADWPLPAGWKAVTVRGPLHIAPNGRTKAGKAAAAALTRLSPGNPVIVINHPDYGLPGAFFDARSRFVEPGVLRTDDALYTAWITDPADSAAAAWTGAHIDTDRWEKIPLSAYYTAREEHVAQAGQGTPA